MKGRMTEVVCDLNHTEVSLIGSVEEEDDWTGTTMPVLSLTVWESGSDVKKLNTQGKWADDCRA